MELRKIAIIGSGATAIYLLKHIDDNIGSLRHQINSITIFERSANMGIGMPYSPETTDIYNLANISSEEIPELPETFGNWLRDQSNENLVRLNITELPIKDSEVYGRLALGSYLHEQYLKIFRKLQRHGIDMVEIRGADVTDIIFDKQSGKSTVRTYKGDHSEFSKTVIATGHSWNETDSPANGYFGSPWPIKKLLPATGETYGFTIGTLGASLSAFDVATSLAHRHGRFMKNGNGLSYELKKGAEGFKLAMHSAEGWLPHLQYEQTEPIREIYRHADKESILSLIDESGFLSIETFFDRVCRPALIKALKKDGMDSLANDLRAPGFGFRSFVKMMSDNHDYTDSFQGMKKEMVRATDSVNNNRPIHWMETLDDLMYCLNFHAELLPAEDHLFFKKEVSPFLMNVIAALPLSSANILLALYNAGCVELVTGRVRVLEEKGNTGKTRIEVEDKDRKKTILEYRMFVNCAGQRNIELDDFPFPSLVESGHIRRASAKIAEESDLQGSTNGGQKTDLIFRDGERFLPIGGIDIDAAYRIIGCDGRPNAHIMDITFTHTSGIRPYSYGLQACSATSKILVMSWLAQEGDGTFRADIEDMTALFKENGL